MPSSKRAATSRSAAMRCERDAELVEHRGGVGGIEVARLAFGDGAVGNDVALPRRAEHRVVFRQAVDEVRSARD